MTAPLQGRRALVVGASRGIGSAVAARLAADGAAVLAVARDADALSSVLDGLEGTGHTSFSGDVTDGSIRTDLVSLLDAWGHPDIVVSGLRVRDPWTTLRRTDAIDFAASVRRNTEYLVDLIRAIVPSQRQNGFGRWVVISSVVASLGGPGQAAYVAQKSALESLMRALAVEEGHHRITANVVAPGFISTEGTRINYEPVAFDALCSMNALGRGGEPDEVAHVVSMLVDPRAGFVTGVTVPVSGGMELGWPFLGVGGGAAQLSEMYGSQQGAP